MGASSASDGPGPGVLRALVTGHNTWYQIELAPGIVTPGTHRSSEALALLDRLRLPKNASGEYFRALDASVDLWGRSGDR